MKQRSRNPAFVIVAAIIAFELVGAASLPCLDQGSKSQVLASWNEGGAKAAIQDFVTTVTTIGPHFIPPSERIAVL